MTDIHKLIDTVEASEAFQEFKTAHPNQYLVHIFTQVKEGTAPMEVGYYDKDADKITVFTGDPVTAKPPEDVYKDGGMVQQLALPDVKLGLADAQEKAEALRIEKYSAHPVIQAICVLQQLDVPMWNLTLVLATLNILNLHIHANSGEIVHEELRNIMDLRKK